MTTKLQARTTALAVIDMQEGFRPAISDFVEVAERIGRAVEGARLLGVPVLVTEQYPRGLKHTAPEVGLGSDSAIEKMTFSSCGVSAFGDALQQRGVRSVLLTGIEAHICVTQTALDLLEKGYQVHLLEDCITSRQADSKRIALDRLLRAGAVPSNLEMALFELMGSAECPQFKAIQKLIR